MNGTSKIREDEGGCRRRGGWKKEMSRKREVEEGDIEKGVKMTRERAG